MTHRFLIACGGEKQKRLGRVEIVSWDGETGAFSTLCSNSAWQLVADDSNHTWAFFKASDSSWGFGYCLQLHIEIKWLKSDNDFMIIYSWKVFSNSFDSDMKWQFQTKAHELLSFANNKNLNWVTTKSLQSNNFGCITRAESAISDYSYRPIIHIFPLCKSRYLVWKKTL